MSDVEIIFPNAKAPLAERLREAIARAGYEVAPGGGVAPEEAPTPGDAHAILFLWDRSSIMQPGLQQAAAAARNRGRAVDVSADGITPVDLIDETRLIQLSAWRGEPTHPGWRKIVAELERLCGGHRVAAAARPAPSQTPAERRSGASADGERDATRGRAAKLAGICAALIVALMLVGYFTLSRRSAVPNNAPRNARSGNRRRATYGDARQRNRAGGSAPGRPGRRPRHEQRHRAGRRGRDERTRHSSGRHGRPQPRRP